VGPDARSSNGATAVSRAGTAEIPLIRRLVISPQFPLSIVLGVAAGGLAGFVNGVLINYVNIPAFITTLGMLYIARGLVVFLTNSLPVAPLPGEFNVIGQG